MSPSPVKSRPGSVPRATGDFLARMAQAMRRANARRMTSSELSDLIARELALAEPYLQGLVSRPERPAQGDRARASSLGLDALERLNTLLPWSQLVDQGADLPVGTWWSDAKSQRHPLDPDHSVEVLSRRLELRGLSVLDVGCLEGLQAIGLARAGAMVCAVDGRIENVVKTLVRTWLAGVEESVRVQWLDVQAGPLSARLVEWGCPARFDLVHHSAVLNHLMRPVEHLADCAAICSGLLYLNTMVADCSDDAGDEQVSIDGLGVALVRRAESKSPHVPFGGLQPESRWLTRDSLDRLLPHLGFKSVQVIRMNREGPGLRVQLLASRQHLRSDIPLRLQRDSDLPEGQVTGGHLHDRRAAWPVSAGTASPDSQVLSAPPADAADTAARPDRYRKVIILGTGRSGTSAVASMLRRHGFFLGPDADEALHESPSLRTELLSGRMERVQAMLDDWQQSHPRVAWKDPKIHTMGARWLRTLPQDWLVLAVFRDPVAVAQRRVQSDGLSFEAALALSVEGQSTLLATLQGVDKKLVVLSYERLLQKPLAVIEEVRALLDLPPADVPSAEVVWQAMRADQASYRQAQDHRLDPQPTQNGAP